MLFKMCILQISAGEGGKRLQRQGRSLSLHLLSRDCWQQHQKGAEAA